jgi:hypothetical protein
MQEGRYYKNAKGDSYDGGDTLLRDMYPYIVRWLLKFYNMETGDNYVISQLKF